MWILRSILDHFDIDAEDWRSIGVAAVGVALIVGIVFGLLVLRFIVWRLDHPDSPFWR